MDIRHNFAINLKRVRLERGFTQKQLSAAASVPVRTIQDLEAGKNSATVSTAVPLAVALGVTVEYLALTEV